MIRLKLLADYPQLQSVVLGDAAFDFVQLYILRIREKRDRFVSEGTYVVRGP